MCFTVCVNHLCSSLLHAFSGLMNLLLLLWMWFLVTQSCPTLCESMDYSPPGSWVHRDSPGRNTGVGCHALLHQIFPTQGWNAGLPHGRRILYHLSHKGSQAGNLGSDSGSQRSPGGGNGNPPQDPCLGNPMDRGAWRATVHGVTKSPWRHNWAYTIRKTSSRKKKVFAKHKYSIKIHSLAYSKEFQGLPLRSSG